MTFASQVHFLYSADRAWTEGNVVPLFDWNANPARAQQAWQGFLTWGQWNDPLFASMLPYTQQAFTHMNDLDEQADEFVAALASVAAYSRVDPWIRTGWLFQFMREVDDRHRADWASEFGRNLEALSAEGSTTVWQRWLSGYWDARITGVPRPLVDVEREAMFGWICPLKDHLATVTAHLMATPTKVLDHFTLHRLRQCEIAKSHGRAIAELLSRLLPHVTELRYDTGELFDLASTALAHGADRTHVRQIANEMLRLGCRDAELLRERAENAQANGIASNEAD